MKYYSNKKILQGVNLAALCVFRIAELYYADNGYNINFGILQNPDKKRDFHH